jgi:hypothetical protein
VSRRSKDDASAYRAEIASLRLYSTTLPRRGTLAGAPDGWEPDSCEAEGGAALPLSSRTAFETDNGVAVNPAIAVELQLTSAVALDPPVGSLCAEVNSTGARVIL